MALTATFAADFDRFESALKSATFDLQTFDRATSTAMQKLKRETEGFSGQKVAVEAARMTEAVTRLGGAGGSAAGLLKLLPAELQRVSAALETAAAKAKLMGETLPPSLQKMREEIAKLPAATTPATTGISGLASAFKALGPLLGVTSIAGAALAIGRLGMSAIESAGQINDLSKQLGVSTDFIQEMQHVADQTGSSVETFAKATFTLGVNVAKGSEAARDAVKDLGLSYQELGRQLPEDQLRTVIKALEDVENVQKRNELGTALLGKTWKEMATAVAEGMSDIAANAPKMSQATVDALDNMGDAWDRMKARSKVAVGTFIADLWTAINQIELAADAMDNWSKIKLFFGAASGDLTAYLAKLKEIGIQMEANAALAGMRPAVSHGPDTTKAAEDYAKTLADINKKIAKLEPGQLKQLTAAIALGGEAAKEYAESIGLGADGLEVFKDHTAKAAAALKELNKDMDESKVWGGGIAEATHWMERLAEESRALELPKAVEFAKMFEMGPDINMGTFQKWLDSRTEAVRMWSQTNQKEITSIFEFGPDPQIGKLTEQFAKAAQTIKGTFAAAFKDMPQVIMKALQGGGDVGKSIGALFGSSIFGEGSDLVKKTTGGLTKGLGKMIGGIAGSIIPGLGTIVGAFAGEGIQKLLGKVFGGEGKQVNKLRDQFTAAAGGIDKLAEHARQAGISMQAFFAADTVKEYEAAIKDLDGAFKALEANRALAGGIFDDIVKLGEEGIPDFLQPHIDQLIELGLLTEDQVAQLRQLADAGSTNWDKIRQAADKYGVRLESLGQPFNAQRIGADAASIINAFTAITNAGGDVGGVLFDMQDEISKVVQDSAKFGTTIPANMKPWIEELIRAGLLVDENGQLITDMGRIQFGDEITTEAEKTRKAFEGITEAIRELIRTINSIPAIPSPGGGGVSRSPAEPGPGLASGAVASVMAGAGGGHNTFTVPIQVDGRTIADVVIDQMGNRLSVRGAR